jgi:ribosomal-protein-alanine N-acetyltransferase
MQAGITIRPYQTNDNASILLLFDRNTPPNFAPEEREGLIHYLDHEIDHYFVVEVDGMVVGCGGINFSDNQKTGVLSWDIIHPDFQGKALGSALVQHRIGELLKVHQVQKIVVRTSQLSYKFYEKMGFQLLESAKDYWAPGFDLYNMVYSPYKTAVPT